MTAQEEKFLLSKHSELQNLLGCRVKIRSVIKEGFTFIPDGNGLSVPDAFCLIHKSKLNYNTMRLSQAKTGQYWIEITFTDVPYRKTEYWNGKKYIEYK